MRATERPTGGDSFQSYLESIRAIPLLSIDEERALARRFRDEGDSRAAHRLIECNLRFVVKVALEFRRYGTRLPDLVQEGNLGLMRAVQKYDPDREARLVSYAVHWIRAYIRAHVMRTWSMVTIGRSRLERQLFFSLARAQAEVARTAPEIWGELGSTEAERVARKLEVPLRAVEEMQVRAGARDTSLDAPLSDDGDGRLVDLLPAEAAPADAAVTGAELRALLGSQIEDALGHLDPRERDIISRRYLAEDMPETLADIAADHRVSRERIRQLELRGLEKLRLRLRRIASQLDFPRARSGRALYDRSLVKGARSRDRRSTGT